MLNYSMTSEPERTLSRPHRKRFKVATFFGDMSIEMEYELGFGDGPRSSTDVSAICAHRTLAQIRPSMNSDMTHRRGA